MAKARRKHPGFNSLEQSPQGRQFLSFVFAAAGDDLDYAPAASTRDGYHLFRVFGSRGRGVLVEGPDRVEDGIIVGRTGFRHDIAEPPIVVQAEVTTHRFDAWIWAQHSGDRSLLEGSAYRRRRESDRRSSAVGAASDRLAFTVSPAAEAPADVGGLGWELASALAAEPEASDDGVDEVWEDLVRRLTEDAPGREER